MLNTTIALLTSYNFWNVHYVSEKTRLADKEKSLGLADRLGILGVAATSCLPVLKGRDLNNGNQRGFACEIINKDKQVGTRELYYEYTDLISPLTALSWHDCYGIPFEIACMYILNLETYDPNVSMQFPIIKINIITSFQFQLFQKIIYLITYQSNILYIQKK